MIWDNVRGKLEQSHKTVVITWFTLVHICKVLSFYMLQIA